MWSLFYYDYKTTRYDRHWGVTEWLLTLWRFVDHVKFIIVFINLQEHCFDLCSTQALLSYLFIYLSIYLFAYLLLLLTFTKTTDWSLPDSQLKMAGHSTAPRLSVPVSKLIPWSKFHRTYGKWMTHTVNHMGSSLSVLEMSGCWKVESLIL